MSPDPEVLGIPYMEALALLREAGVRVSRVHTTRPPRALVGLGQLRVVGQRVQDHSSLTLILAYENYEDRWKGKPGEGVA